MEAPNCRLRGRVALQPPARPGPLGLLGRCGACMGRCRVCVGRAVGLPLSGPHPAPRLARALSRVTQAAPPAPTAPRQRLKNQPKTRPQSMAEGSGTPPHLAALLVVEAHHHDVQHRAPRRQGAPLLHGAPAMAAPQAAAQAGLSAPPPGSRGPAGTGTGTRTRPRPPSLPQRPAGEGGAAPPSAPRAMAAPGRREGAGTASPQQAAPRSPPAPSKTRWRNSLIPLKYHFIKILFQFIES